MRDMDLPVGMPRKYAGDLNGLFGFAEVTVKVPVNMRVPFLTIKTPKGVDKNISNFSPVGRFRGVFFSEELKHAIMLGCKVLEIHKAYEYDRGRPFEAFIDRF